ncbi:MAG: cytochrome c oxidase assembly protein [Dehalococcoidia bacterium]|jgi:putative membrane protein|nr:cytochrome c oxidase assembly protein [Dehalococcoidia bacterium]
MTMAATTVSRLLPGVPPAHGAEHGGEWWQAWNFDPEVIVPVVLAGLLYVNGLRRWRDRSRSHPPWRTALYFGGLALLLLAVESPLDYLGEHHFTFHMAQHELLLMLAVPMILLGAPTTPSLLGMPRRLRMGVVRRLAGAEPVRRLYRFVTSPLIAVALLTALLWAWHLAPGWYDAALENALVHDLQHISYVVAGLLFWWNVIDPAPLKARLPYPLRMAYLLIGGTPKHFLGALVTFADPLYDVYQEVEPVFALSVPDDQVIGGLIMWAWSQMMHLIVIAAVFFIWARRAEAEQQALDAGWEAADRPGGVAIEAVEVSDGGRVAGPGEGGD